MRTRILIGVLALALGCGVVGIAPVMAQAPAQTPAAPAASTAQADAILQKMTAAFATVKTMSMDIATKLNMQGQQFTSNGQYIGEPGTNKFNMVSTTTIGQMQIQTRTVSDGQMVWIEMDMGAQKMVQKMSLALLEKMGGSSSDPFNAGKRLASQMDFMSVGEGNSPAGPVYVLEGTYKPAYREQMDRQFQNMPNNPQATIMKKQLDSIQKIRVMILKDSMMPCGQEMIDAQGNVVSSFTCTNVKMNPPVAADTFAYTPPAGVQVMDMDQMMNAQAQPQPPAAPAK